MLILLSTPNTPPSTYLLLSAFCHPPAAPLPPAAGGALEIVLPLTAAPPQAAEDCRPAPVPAGMLRAALRRLRHVAAAL
jgi:hypothetical protein